MNDIKYKYSLTFSKKGLLVFLSQLDMMRLFGRVLQKSGLPLAYSQGFNPHPRYSLPYPLSVGYTGRTEILELYLTEYLPEKTLPELLNNHLPADIQITSAVFGTLPAPQYSLRVVLESEAKLPENWQALTYTKETKRGNVTTYRLGENLQIKTEAQEIVFTPLTDNSFKAEKICDLLDIAQTDIVEIIREC